jgi:hypothetical protein
VARVLLKQGRLREESVSAQTNRKQCEFAKASVKFDYKKKKTEQQEEEQDTAVKTTKANWIIGEERMTDSQAAYLKP